jgi:hypothetical protein
MENFQFKLSRRLREIIATAITDNFLDHPLVTFLADNTAKSPSVVIQASTKILNASNAQKFLTELDKNKDVSKDEISAFDFDEVVLATFEFSQLDDLDDLYNDEYYSTSRYIGVKVFFVLDSFYSENAEKDTVEISYDYRYFKFYAPEINLAEFIIDPKFYYPDGWDEAEMYEKRSSYEFPFYNFLYLRSVKSPKVSQLEKLIKTLKFPESIRIQPQISVGLCKTFNNYEYNPRHENSNDAFFVSFLATVKNDDRFDFVEKHFS